MRCRQRGLHFVLQAYERVQDINPRHSALRVQLSEVCELIQHGLECLAASPTTGVDAETQRAIARIADVIDVPIDGRRPLPLNPEERLAEMRARRSAANRRYRLSAKGARAIQRIYQRKKEREATPIPPQ